MQNFTNCIPITITTRFSKPNTSEPSRSPNIDLFKENNSINQQFCITKFQTSQANAHVQTLTFQQRFGLILPPNSKLRNKLTCPQIKIHIHWFIYFIACPKHPEISHQNQFIALDMSWRASFYFDIFISKYIKWIRQCNIPPRLWSYSPCRTVVAGGGARVSSFRPSFRLVPRWRN